MVRVLVALLLTAVLAACAGDPAPPVASPHASANTVARPAGLAAWLAWDRRRSDAWTHRDAAGLRRLYVGAAGDADVALLRRYAARGLRVTGLRSQVLAALVVRRSPDHLVLRVTDRLVAGTAVDRAGHRTALPRGQPRTQVITLAAGRAGWRVARIRPG